MVEKFIKSKQRLGFKPKIKDKLASNVKTKDSKKTKSLKNILNLPNGL